MRKVRIGFLLPRYSRRSTSLMPAVVQALADDGAIVDVLHPVEQIVDLSAVRVEHDLYVLRRWGGLALSLAGALHELGASIVNRYSVTAALRDKIVTARVLQAAGTRCLAPGSRRTPINWRRYSTMDPSLSNLTRAGTATTSRSFDPSRSFCRWIDMTSPSSRSATIRTMGGTGRFTRSAASSLA